MNNRILKILSEIRPEYDFSGSIKFIDDGMLDSFDIIALVSALDEEFGISIDGMDILPENFQTLEAIISLLKKNGVQL